MITREDLQYCAVKINDNVYCNIGEEKLVLSNNEEELKHHNDLVRYVKMQYRTIENLWDESVKSVIDRFDEEPIFEHDAAVKVFVQEWWENFKPIFEEAIPFTYKEAFEIGNETVRAWVFALINIEELVENLGGQRIATDGVDSVQFIYDDMGNKVGEEKITNVYEVYECNAKPLTDREDLIYAVKCWCTSTNNAHYIWIDEKYKNDPVSAIAATFHVPKELLDKNLIKHIKRQGDILLCELTDENYEIQEPEKTVALTREQYFGKLVCQA